MHVARSVASQRHSPLLADASVGQDRAERMPQAVVAQRVHTAPRFASLADDALLDARRFHEQAELFRQRTDLALRQRWEQERVVACRRRKRQEMIVEHRMNARDDLSAGFSRLEADGLDLGDKIDIAPAKIREVVQSLAGVKTSE